MNTDVIVVGAGLSGIATALGAALAGRKAVVLEAADLVGGAAAYSGGQVWVGANHVEERQGIADDLDRTESYIRAISYADPGLIDEDALRVWLEAAPEAMRFWEEQGAIAWEIIPGLIDYYDVDGALGEGRYLTNAPIDGSELGAWRARLRVSPYFPVGTTYTEMMQVGRRVNTSDQNVHAFGDPTNVREEQSQPSDILTFGTGVVASFLARAIKEEAITILTEHRVAALVTDDEGAVVGVRATTPDGDREFSGIVVLATSTYDWDADLAEEMTGLDRQYFASVAPDSLRGDGITLVREIGGAIAKIPPSSIPMLPGWRTADGEIGYGPEFAKPHSMIVDSRGKRFCNDSYWPDLVKAAYEDDGAHLPMFLIWDEQHRLDYGLGTTPPGGTYPEGLVTSAATLPELADRLGIDGAGLAETVERFNPLAEQGLDPEFGRGTSDYVHRFYGDTAHLPNSVLGAITEAPFHGLRLSFVGTGIGSSGIHIDPWGRVRRDAGGLVPGLYAAGSCTALTPAGTGYNSGFALARGLTIAYLIHLELTGVAHGEPTR